MSMRSPLGRIRGLGSAKDGTGHWWAQRVTALALVPLTFWFVVSIFGVAGSDYFGFVAWLSSPLVAGLMILLIVATFHHAQLGLQVIIEDYVHEEGVKIAALLMMKAVVILLGLTGVLAVLKIAVGGP
ncbi:MAG: succinate dehydrogenase, hydrophobic membrane anchor protein [Alphaproteobacteria bacterium]